MCVGLGVGTIRTTTQGKALPVPGNAAVISVSMPLVAANLAPTLFPPDHLHFLLQLRAEALSQPASALEGHIMHT